MKCFKCETIFKDVETLITHIKEVEGVKNEKEKNFTLSCIDCDLSFLKFLGFKKHMEKHHLDEKQPVSLKRKNEINSIETIEGKNEENMKKQKTDAFIQNLKRKNEIISDGKNGEKFEENSKKQKLDAFIHNFEKYEEALEEFLMNLAIFGIPDSQQDVIMDFIHKIIRKSDKICTSAIEENPSVPIKAINQANVLMLKSVDKFRTSFLRKKFFQRQADYVPPREIAITIRYEHKFNPRSGNYFIKSVQSSFMYVSPLETLTRLLQHEEIRDLMFKSNHVCTPGIYRAFCCCQNYKKNPFFQTTAPRIRVTIYGDEVEPCDALKSAAGVHKMYQFYLEIDNLPYHLQAMLDNIKLLASAYTIDLSANNADLNDLLAVVRRDLNELEIEGIKVPGFVEQIKGTLVKTKHDNLGK